jgi:hypothetical protein
MDREALRKENAIKVLRKRIEELTEEFERDKEAFEREKTYLERSIQSLRPAQKNGEIKPGRWAGMDKADAVHAYLQDYCNPGRVPFQTVLKAMQIGGLHLGEKENREQSILTTTLRQNTLFILDPAKPPQWVQLRPPRLAKRSRPAVRRDEPAAAAIDAPRV